VPKRGRHARERQTALTVEEHLIIGEAECALEIGRYDAEMGGSRVEELIPVVTGDSQIIL